MLKTMLTRGTRFSAVVALMTALVFASTQSAPAADAVKEESSLAFVPSDAAFFSATLRQKEQFEALVNSNAFEELRQIPAIAQLEQQLLFGMGMAAGFTADPQNRELVEMLGDMFSHEIFTYGDIQVADVITLINRWNVAGSVSGARAAMRQNLDGTGETLDAEGESMQAFLSVLQENRDLIGTPNIFLGFRLADPERGKRQLQRLGVLLSILSQQRPELAERLQQSEIDGSDYITFQLDGEMIPWQELPVDDVDAVLEEYKDVVDQVTDLKLTIALGARGDYLLLAFLDSPDRLKLEAGKLLYDRDELAALRKHSDKPLTSIGYTSAEFAARTGNIESQLDAYQGLAGEALAETDLDASLQKEILADIQKLRETIEKVIPKPGAECSFKFRTDRGYEGYSYDWGEKPQVDASQQLPILKHVGGNPILFHASRSKVEPGDSETFFRLLARGHYYFEEFAVPQLDEDEQRQYSEFRDAVLPILKRMKTTTVEKLIPAFEDGQGGLVLSASIAAEQWFPAMPPADAPLPMLELAILLGVSDAESARQAGEEYFAAIRDLLKTVHELQPEDFPAGELPSPDVLRESGNTIYQYQIPEAAGVNEQIVPNAGLSEDFLVLSYSPAQTKRLLAETPLAIDSKPFEAHSGPLASALSFNWPALLDAIVPWIDYGVRQATSQDLVAAQNEQDNPALENDPAEMILGQVHAAIKILKCYRGYSSVTYREGDAFVTHGESVWKDLE